MTLDDLLNKQYDKMNYNCFHFMMEAFEYFYGVDISEQFNKFLEEGMTTRRQTTMFHKCGYKEAQIVLINYWDGLHCGLMVHGRLLHITDEYNVKWEPLEQVSIFAYKIRYYEYNQNPAQPI